MPLLLCAATKFEIAPAIDFIETEKLDVDVLITGVGLTASTYSLTKAIHNKKPDFILQAGIAGALTNQFPLTKVVIVEHEQLGDQGVQQGNSFQSVFDLGLVNGNDFPWKDGKLSNNIESLKNSGLTVVNGVTVNEISTDEKRLQYYRNELNAQIESMEGAALHYVALMEKIRFLQIRSLSNFAGERNKENWVIEMAMASLNHELKKILIKQVKK